MLGKRRNPVVRDHLIGVAVIRRHQRAAAHGENFVRHLFHAFVHGMHRFHRRFHDARMAHHVAVGEVEDEHVVNSLVKLLENLVRHEVGAHFGLEVIGGHLRGGNDDAGFALDGRFDFRVEEKRHVRVFFRFGDMQLFQPQRGNILGQSIVDFVGRERDAYVFERGIIDGKAHIGRGKEARFALEAQLRARLGVRKGKLLLRKHARNLPRAVGTEVEADDAVALADQRDGRAVFGEVGGKDKLIRHARRIGRFRGVRGAAFKAHAFAQSEHIVRLFLAVPVVVAVHGVISARDGSDFTEFKLVELVLQLLEEARARSGGDVSAVRKGVDIYVVETLRFRHFDERVEVFEMAVHPARGDETVKVQLFAARLRGVHGAEKLLVFKERPVADVLGDLGEILIDDPPRADIEVTHLRIAHLSVGKPYGHAAGAELCGGVGLFQCGDIFTAVEIDGVAVGVLVDSVAVHDDDGVRRLHK